MLVDHWGAQCLVVAGNLLQAVGFAGYCLIAYSWQLFLCALSVAIGTQLCWTANGAFLAQVASPAGRNRWFALQGACRSAGLGGGAALAGVAVALTDASGYGWLAALNALSFVVAAVLIARVAIDTPAGDSGPDAATARMRRRVRRSASSDGAWGYRHLLSDWPFLGFTATNVAFSLIVLSSTLALPVYIVGVLHQPLWVVGALFSMNTVMVTLAQMFVVKWVERYRRTHALAFAAGLFGVSFLTLASLASPLLGRLGFRVWVFGGLVVAMGIYTLAELVMAPLKNAFVADTAPDEQRGRYMAFYHLSWSVASAAAPVLLLGLLGEGHSGSGSHLQLFRAWRCWRSCD